MAALLYSWGREAGVWLMIWDAEGIYSQSSNHDGKTLTGKFQILANSLNVLGESIGHSLSLALKPIVSISTEVVNRVNAILVNVGSINNYRYYCS